MAKIYAALIRKGIKTLDEVPARLRSTVEALLDAEDSAIDAPDDVTQEEYRQERKDVRTCRSKYIPLQKTAAKSCRQILR
jgi:hypothetical protein